MENVKVSVIVPVYNSEKYLKRCLDSLINQTLKDLEIVVINDGSTDGSAQIIKEYLERFPDRFIYREKENGGQATARNLAFSLCNGDYIGFLDSDDYVKLEMFEKLYNKAVETGSDYVACGFTDVLSDENNNLRVTDEYVASKVPTTIKDMYIGAYVCPFLHLYRREIIINNNIKFPEGLIYEDTAFYLELIPYLKKIATIEEPLAYRVKHQNSTMSTISASRVSQIFDVFDCVLDFYEKNGFNASFYDELEYFVVRVLLCSSMERIGKIKGWNNKSVVLNKTMEFIEDNFANYKANPYFNGGFQNLYMKSINRANVKLYLFLISIKVAIVKDRG